MGLSESRPSTVSSPAPMSPSSVIRRSNPSSKDSKQRGGSHLFFYDASKSSVAIFNGVNTLTRKFQTLKSTSTPGTSSSVAVESVDSLQPPINNLQGCTYADETLISTAFLRQQSCRSSSYDNVQGVLPISGDEDNLSQTSYEDVTIGDFNYRPTCHVRSDIATLDSDSFKSGDKDPMEERLRGAELRQMIDKFNSIAAKGYEMELKEDEETFQGFIRVSINVTLPVKVITVCRPPSIYDIMSEDQHEVDAAESFYLPRNTVKSLHVTSETSTHELIVTLFRKFKMLDSPQKYCLYEKYCIDGESSVRGVLRRIEDDEKPLWLVLGWPSEEMTNRRLVLQENDTGDIMWEDFTFAELHNFLRILDREEEEYLNQVRVKYLQIESQLRKALEQFH